MRKCHEPTLEAGPPRHFVWKREPPRVFVNVVILEDETHLRVRVVMVPSHVYLATCLRYKNTPRASASLPVSRSASLRGIRACPPKEPKHKDSKPKRLPAGERARVHGVPIVCTLFKRRQRNRRKPPPTTEVQNKNNRSVSITDEKPAPRIAACRTSRSASESAREKPVL